MARDEQLKERWGTLKTTLTERFAEGDDLDIDGIIYLVGVSRIRTRVS